MAAQPWRGTLIYVGAVAVMTAAGVAKFGGVAPDPAAAPTINDAPSADGGTTDDGSSGSGPAGPAGTGAGSTDADADDVTIVGSVAQTRYGDVQLSVTFSGARITDVQALQAPDRERRDYEITQTAIPVLTQEAIAAQSAQIDTVSGATYTSEGYKQSLQSAIDQRG